VAYILDKKVVTDTEEFSNQAYGITLPVQRGNSGFFATAFTSFEQAKSNLKNLLLTNIGERPHQPEFGSKLLSVVFEFKDDALIEQVINEAVDKWLPYITIEEVNTTVDGINPNRLNVELKFSVSTAPNAKDQIILDFNTTG